MTRWVIRVAVAAAAVIAAPAWALDTGQCLPAAQVRAALAAEAMSPIIVGNRTGYGYPTSLIFFSNTDGSKGYLIRGDKPLGQQADTACIDSVYRDVRLNDITRPGIPAWALMPGIRADLADATCGRDHLGFQELCNFHNDSVAGLEKNGQRVMFIATGTAINPRDKSIRTGQRLTITVSPDKAGGLIKATTADGASYMLSAYTNVSYTQFGNELLTRQIG